MVNRFSYYFLCIAAAFGVRLMSGFEALAVTAQTLPAESATAVDITCPDPASRKVWSLEECLEYAMAHNLEIKQKVIARKKSDVEVEAGKGALFPSLSFSTSQSGSWRPWSKSYVSITDGSLATTTSSLNYNGTYGLQAQWTAWDGGVTRKRYDRSKLAARQSEVEVETTRLDIKEDLIKAYMQILYQKSAVEVCEKILSSTKELAVRGREMYDVGNMSKADLAQLEAQVSQEEYNLTNAQTTLAEFKLQLRTLLELTDTPDMDVKVPDSEDAQITSLLPEVNEIYAKACATRPELQYSRIGIELADMDIDIAKRGYYPTIGFSACINTNTVSGMGMNWGEQMKTNLSNSLGLTLSVPIFDKKQNSTNVARAKLDMETARIDMELKEKQLYNEIENYRLTALNARQQYLSAMKNVEAMRESYQLVSEQFSLGLKDIVDLTTGKNNLIQAEQQMLEAKFTALLNRKILELY